MEFGVVLPNMGGLARPDVLIPLAQEAEALGFDSLWVSDHIVVPPYRAQGYPYSRTGVFPIPPEAPIAEPLMTLGVLAGVTRRVRLGVSVLVLPYRNPILTAKLLSTLDWLSGGRVILGVGAGWMREEFEALGADYEHRGGVTDEWIRIFRTLWTEPEPSFEGRFYRFAPLKFEPKPVRGSIPIWVGGHTDPALRRAVRLGDGWHAVRATPAEMREARDRLLGLCREHGRDPASLVLSVRSTLAFLDGPRSEGAPPMTGTADQILRDVEDYREAGVSHLVVGPRGENLEEMVGHLRRFAREVMPRLRQSQRREA